MKKNTSPSVIVNFYLADEFFFPIEDEHLRDSSTRRNRFFIRSYFKILLIIIWMTFHSKFITKNIEYYGKEGLLKVVKFTLTPVIFS